MSFTCAACGGFKYKQTPVMRYQPNTDINEEICQDCYENGALNLTNYGIKPKKPGLLHEVLMACYKAGWHHPGNSFDKFIKANGGSEEDVAASLQNFCSDMWKAKYLEVTGEYWQ